MTRGSTGSWEADGRGQWSTPPRLETRPEISAAEVDKTFLSHRRRPNRMYGLTEAQTEDLTITLSFQTPAGMMQMMMMGQASI